MAKKNFTDNLLGSNRSKKLDILVSGGNAKEDQEKKETAVEVATPEPEPVAKTSPKKKTAVPSPPIDPEPQSSQPVESKPEPPKPKKRGRKKKDIDKDSFFYTVEKDFLFEVRAAAFWDRRDISEFISIALKHYMYEEMGESEVRRAVREYKKRLEE